MDKRLNNLNNLRCFESAARLESYSKAAIELCLSQAAVSQKMRQLEESLNTKLFMRQGRKMTLTECGEKLLAVTQQAFNVLVNGLNDIQSEGIDGSLTITSTPAFTSMWLMPKLHEFSMQHPEIKIRVASSNRFEDLKQNQIDLAIRFGTSVNKNTSTDFKCEYFGQDEVYPVCSKKLADKIDFDNPQDILKTWLVRLEKQGPYNWQAWFDAAGVLGHEKHTQWTEVVSTDIGLSAVASGHGFTLAAKSLYREGVESGNLVIPIKIKHPAAVKRYLVFDENSPKRARLEVFMNWLKREMSA